MCADLRNLVTQSYKITKNSWFIGRVPQQRGRMIGGHKKCAVFVKKLSVITGNGKTWVDQLLGRDTPQANNNFGTQKLELLTQPWDACCRFFRQRITVLRGTAFHDVCDVYILLAVQIYSFEIMVQKLSAAAHKGESLGILVGAGTLTHKKYFCVGGTLSKDHMGARFT